MPSNRQKELAVTRAALLVLVVAVALLHALFVAGPGHIAALDSDGCRSRVAATAEVALDTCCDSVAAEAAVPMGWGHHPGSGATSCEASFGLQAKSAAPTPRQAVLAGTATSADALHPIEPPAVPAGASSSASSPSSVLRC